MKLRKKSLKMHVKRGDTVQIISGKDKNKVGPIIKVFPQKKQVLVQAINIKTKHTKPQKEGESGKIEQVEFPIHTSKVMLYSSNFATASRIRHTINSAGIKVRQLIKTNEIIN